MQRSSDTLGYIFAVNDVKLELPCNANSPDKGRDGTVFIMSTENDYIHFVGTFDQLADFASDMLAKLFTWPAVTGHSDWFGPEDQAWLMEGIKNANRSEDDRIEVDGNSGGSGERARVGSGDQERQDV
jgi:hypothetical protein